MRDIAAADRSSIQRLEYLLPIVYGRNWRGCSGSLPRRRSESRCRVLSDVGSPEAHPTPLARGATNDQLNEPERTCHGAGVVLRSADDCNIRRNHRSEAVITAVGGAGETM